MDYQVELEACAEQKLKLSTQEIIPGHILARRDISINAKRVYAQIAFYAGAGLVAVIGTQFIADRLDLSRKTVSRAVGRLQGVGLLKIKHSFKETNEYSIRAYSPKKFFLLLDNNNSRHNIADKLILAYLKLRQGQNNTAWPKQATIARELGLSIRKVQQSLAALEEAGYIKTNHVNGGIRQHNSYSFNQCRTELRSRSESRAHNCPTIDNNCNELKTIKPVKSSILLSAGAAGENQTEKRALLIANRVHSSVANEIAADSRVSVASVKAAIYNGLARNDKNGVWRMRPGYIVAAINAANAEGKAVRLSKAGRTVLSEYNAAKAKQAVRTAPLSGDELAARKEFLKRQAAMLLAEEVA